MRNKRIQAGFVYTTNQGCRCEVIEYQSAINVRIRFIDRYGIEKSVRADHLRNGRVNNPYCPTVYGVGFIGVGEHSPTFGGRSTIAGERWRQMLKRCYEDGYKSKNPTYKDCTVKDEWLNFQSFAEWHMRQPNHDDRSLELDKDLIEIGNKEYGPDVCSLVPKRVNCLIGIRTKNNGLKTGVSWHSKGRRYQVDCRDENGAPRFLGWYECKHEAAEVYRDFKESVLKKVAFQLKGKIDQRVFDTLISYKVPIS